MSTENENLAPETGMQETPVHRPQSLVTLDDTDPVSPFSSMSAFVKAQRVAQALASSTLVPEAYQAQVCRNGQWSTNPAAIGNCLIALEMSSRMPGLSPLMVMQNMDVVKGRPGWRGAFAAARVNTSPLYSRLKYEWKGEPGTKEYGCRAMAVEVDTEEILYGTWITWAMVVGEGWDKNPKWTTMRDQMFQYRAATFWTRAYAPDLLLGLPAVEEIEDVPALGTVTRASVADLNERLNGAGELVEAAVSAADRPAENAAAPATDDAAASATADAKAPRARRPRAPAVKPLDQADAPPPAPAEAPAPAPAPAADAPAAGSFSFDVE